jgi:hypothetical protein
MVWYKVLCDICGVEVVGDWWQVTEHFYKHNLQAVSLDVPRRQVLAKRTSYANVERISKILEYKE